VNSQEVEVMVLELDKEKRRVSLGLKPIQGNPWLNFAETNSVGSVLEVEIKNITEFGLFVGLGNDIDGINNIISDNFNGFLINCEQGDLKKIFDNFKLQKNNLVDVKLNAIGFIEQNHSLENLANLELADYTKL